MTQIPRRRAQDFPMPELELIPFRRRHSNSAALRDFDLAEKIARDLSAVDHAAWRTDARPEGRAQTNNKRLSQP